MSEWYENRSILAMRSIQNNSDAITVTYKKRKKNQLELI